MAKAGTGVFITGDKAVDRMLRDLPLKVQKKISRSATRKAAREIVLPGAIERVGVNTGDLEASLMVRAIGKNIQMVKRTTGKYAGTMGKKNLNADKFGHEVRTRDGFYAGDQFYGAFVEFGTKERKHKGTGKQVGRIDPAKNFAYLRPAVYDNEARIRALYVSAMKQLLAELPKAK